MPRTHRAALFAGIALLAAPLRAEGSWALRLEGGYGDYSRESLSSTSLAYQRLELGGGAAFGVAAEYRAGPHLGLELSLSRVGLAADWRRYEIQFDPANPQAPRTVLVASDSGELTLQPLAFAVYWHASPAGRFDFYVGPQLAWVDCDVGVQGAPGRDAEWAFGGKLGVDARLGESSGWAGVSLRYLDVQHEGEERDLYTGLGVPVAAASLTWRLGGGSR